MKLAVNSCDHFFLKERRSSFDFRLNHSLGDFFVPR